MRLLVPIICTCIWTCACSPAADSNEMTDMGSIDVTFERGCEGGLVDVDGECVLVTHALEVLLFRSENDPTAQVCARTYTSDDPGIEQAIVAESGACRVIDVEAYGPLNYEPAEREDGVTLTSAGESIQVDETELFDSCIERRDAPDGFFAYGADFVVSFDGNDAIPAFEAGVALPDDPGFARTELAEDAPVVFTWTPTPANEVVAFLSAQNINIVCVTSAASGRLEVPGSLVAMLPEPEPPREEPFSSIRLRNTETVVFGAEDAAVTITADTYQSTFEE